MNAERRSLLLSLLQSKRNPPSGISEAQAVAIEEWLGLEAFSCAGNVQCTKWCGVEGRCTAAFRTPLPEVAMHQWIEAEKAKADAYESAANICEEMSYPPEGRDRWANKEEEWAAIKLEDAAKAIRERKAKVCHVTQAAVSPLAHKEKL